MKILIRGGSISSGYGVEKSYVDILFDKLHGNGEILNRSRFKETSFDGVWSFDTDIDAFRPEILILHFGMDDAFHPVYRSEFKENLVQIIKLARKRFSPKIVLLTSHAFDNQYDMEAVNIYYRAIREVAIDLKCTMVPIHTYWMGYVYDNEIASSDLVQDDSRYPNEKGHEIYADAIMHALIKL